jgi:hypothetical protein
MRIVSRVFSSFAGNRFNARSIFCWPARKAEERVRKTASASLTLSLLGVILSTASTSATPPGIVTQPRSRTNVVSSSLMLSITATGTDPLSYQWFKNETALSGATGRILVLANVQPADAGTYRVTVSNVVSFVTSSNAVLTVVPLEPPSVIGGPLTNPANGHQYYLLGQSTWVEAEAAAQGLNGHLVTLRNTAEQQWVFTNFSTWGGQERILWIGLHDADPVNNATNFLDRRAEFVWSSGEPVIYSNWSAVEPNNYRDRGEYYVHTLPPSDPSEPGAWVDAWDVDFNGRPLHGVVELGGAPAKEPSSWTMGKKTFLFMRVNFPDDLTEPISEEDAYATMAEVNDFYRRNSYGKFSLRTTVTPLLTLPRTKQDYASVGLDPILRDAREAARAAGYDTAAFDLDCVYFPPFYGGGHAARRSKGIWAESPGVIAHELGHNLGLGEANSWFAFGQSIIGPGQWRPYGNLFDTMSSSTRGQFNARSKEYLGWLSNSNVTIVFTNGTYRLYTFEATNSDAAVPCALLLRKDEGRDYWIEFRTETNQWTQWIQYGVLLSWNGSPGSLDTDLLNMNPDLGRNLNDVLHAPLLLGRTFSDREASIHITPLHRNATTPPSVDVAINVGDFAANQPPSVAVAPSATQVATGNLVTLTATAFDPNGDPLSFAWDFSDGTLGTVGAQVSHAWNASGEYIVRCVVSDLKGGVASAFVIVRVGTPDTRRISGRIAFAGQPLEGVRIVTYGTGETYTDSAGNYTLANLPNSRYSVIPLKAYYRFSPGWKNVNATTGDVSEVNFDASASDPPNSPPFVRLQIPERAVYASGASLDLTVGAVDDGAISQIAYYEGTNWLGSSFSYPFQITRTNLSAGQHLVRAVATDDQGVSAGSAEWEMTVVAGAPSNDNFAQSIGLAGSFASVTSHNVGATAEPNEPPNSFLATNSIWYSWAAPTNGAVTLTVKSTQMGPVVIVYTGNMLATLNEAARSSGSSVTFSAVNGVTYRILVAGWARQSGSFSLELRPAQPPANDAFADRTALSSLPVTVSGSNRDATHEPGEPWLINWTESSGASAWWSWTAPGNGVFAVETAGSSFPAAVGVFQGTAINQLTQIAAGLGVEYARWDASARFHAAAGATYQIVVDGQSGGRGEFDLSVRPAHPPTNDDFANRTLLSGTNVTLVGSTVDGSREVGEPIHNPYKPAGGTVWWSWTAPFSGPVIVRSGSIGVPLWLAIYTGTTLPTLIQVANDFIGAGARFNAVAGTAYQIVVDSAYGVSESFLLHIERILPPANDDFAHRTPLSGFVSSGSGANAEATAQAGEPSHAPPASPAHSLWWTWTAPASGSFILDAENSYFATALAVYTGTALGSLTRVADNSMNGNQMTFSATAGTAYQIAVDGKSGTTGNIQFTLRPAFAPPNDSFANRISITGSTARVIGFNTGASAEPGEPLGFNNGASVWWTWMAPSAGLYTVTVTGTTFRVLLGVYTGSTLGTLVRVAGDGLSSFDPAAQTTFRAMAGATYQITVDGRLGSSGAVQLDLRPAQPPINDDFANRIQLTGVSFTGEANNFEASTEPDEPHHLPASDTPDGASVWWGWTPPVTGKYTVQLSAGRVNVLVIYTGNILSGLTRVAKGPGTTVGGSRASFRAVAGTEYQIAVAGLGSVTDAFTLTLGPAASPPNDDFADREPLVGTAVRVHGSTAEALSEPNEPVSGYGASVWYTWIAPATGEAAINTEYNEAHTAITVYTGSALSSLIRLPQNSTLYAGNGRRVTFSAVAGQAYQIVVDSVAEWQGSFHLRLIETPSPIEQMPVFALPVRLEDGAVQLLLSGQPNRAYVLEASEDLEFWIPIATNSAPSGVLIWTDFAATNFTHRFYRARSP